MRTGFEGQEPAENAARDAADLPAEILVAERTAERAAAKPAKRAAERAADKALRRELRINDNAHRRGRGRHSIIGDLHFLILQRVKQIAPLESVLPPSIATRDRR